MSRRAQIVLIVVAMLSGCAGTPSASRIREAACDGARTVCRYVSATCPETSGGEESP